MLENGYILLHRKLINWEWYKNVNVKILFLHLLLTVNYEDKKFEGFVIKRGSRITSIRKLADECGLTVQSTRTAINKLKSTQEITQEQHAGNTVYTVVNYNQYQFINTTSNTLLTHDQHTTNPRLTHNEIKINKDNNINKYIYTATEKFESEELTDAIIAFSEYRKK